MLKKKKFILGGLLVLIALGVLGYFGFQGSATYYYTVSEVMAKGTSLDKDVRVSGKIVDGSINQQTAGSQLQFTITDGQKNFNVDYKGSVPDAFFQPEADVVVEGRLDSAGVFQARTLVAKCPSKYEAQG